MNNSKEWISLLIADDNLDDRRLLARAFQEAGIVNRLDFVNDGEAALEFLNRPAPAVRGHGLPGLILLDLNMPRMDGRELLQTLRGDPKFALIPVVVLSTSNYKEDVLDCYRLGANSVMVKPLGYAEFVDLVTMIKRYWLEHVQLPVQFEN